MVSALQHWQKVWMSNQEYLSIYPLNVQINNLDNLLSIQNLIAIFAPFWLIWLG